MINARAKGAAGERQFCALVLKHTGIELQRKLDQTRGGGHDLECKFPADVSRWPWAVEVKRTKEATYTKMAKWWKQTLIQAEKARLKPLLAWRVDRGKWKVTLKVKGLPVSYDAEDFLTGKVIVDVSQD